MKRPRFVIPEDRKRQFDLIERASGGTLAWARERGLELVRIEPVVPFVDTDFSLDAWLFLDTEAHLLEYRTNGKTEALTSCLLSELKAAGYPEDWSALVQVHFATKEVADRDFEGHYFYFLR